jgi:hypothetical protein
MSVTMLEKELAEALAGAVKYESDKHEGYKRVGGSYQLPLWFASAVYALAKYDLDAAEPIPDQLWGG